MSALLATATAAASRASGGIEHWRNWRPSTANAIVENFERHEHLYPPADYRGLAELRADPYFKVSIRSFASSMPPACARSYSSRAFVRSPEIPRARHRSE